MSFPRQILHCNSLGGEIVKMVTVINLSALFQQCARQALTMEHSSFITSSFCFLKGIFILGYLLFETLKGPSFFSQGLPLSAKVLI